VIGPDQKLLTQVRLGQPPLDLENFHQKSQSFQFFSYQVKKISLDQVRKYQGQRQFGPLFTAGQGPCISTLYLVNFFEKLRERPGIETKPLDLKS